MEMSKNEMEINEDIFNDLVKKIIAMEKRNFKTKKYNQREINKVISEMIERGVLYDYNKTNLE